MNTTSKVLIVVANPSVSTTTGWPVGFWAAELMRPYDAFRREGYEVTIASPDGSKVEMDAYSDPRDVSGYSKDDTLSLQYRNTPEFVALLENTPSVAQLKADDFNSIVVVGGQSPMFTFKAAVGLQQLFLNRGGGAAGSAAGLQRMNDEGRRPDEPGRSVSPGV